MFGYQSALSKISLSTDRLLLRLMNERDAYRLADYYALNQAFLKPWEPLRDQNHCLPAGWQARLSMIAELHKQRNAYYFILLDSTETEVRGVVNFSNVMRGSSHSWLLLG